MLINFRNIPKPKQEECSHVKICTPLDSKYFQQNKQMNKATFLVPEILIEIYLIASRKKFTSLRNTDPDQS